MHDQRQPIAFRFACPENYFHRRFKMSGVVSYAPGPVPVIRYLPRDGFPVTQAGSNRRGSDISAISKPPLMPFPIKTKQNNRMGNVSLSTLWINLIVISGTWGSSFVFVKLITLSMHPFAFAASRGFIAMSALLVWLALRGRRPVLGRRSLRTSHWKTLRHMVVLGTTNGWLSNVLTAVAVSRIDSAVVAMLQASVPLMVAVLAHFFFAEEPFRPRQFIGIMTGLTGILLIVGPIGVFGGRGSLLGITAMLLSALCYACGTIYGRHVASANPAALACGQQACGAAVAVVISLLFEPRGGWSQPVSIWLLLAIVGVICSALPTALYLRLLARAASVPAALVAYLQPIWATLLAWAILGEQVRMLAWLGTGIVVVGVIVTTHNRGYGSFRLRRRVPTA